MVDQLAAELIANPTDVQAVTAQTYRTLNPATGELVKVFPTATDAEAEALLSHAHEAFLAWKAVPLAGRIERLRRLSEIWSANIDRIARQVTTEMGKPYGQAVYEASLPLEMFRYYLENAETFLADTPVEIAGFSRVYTRREPIGVVLAIEPWNGPMYQAIRAAAPNIMLGNAIIVKPAEITVGSTLIIDELFAEAGFPPALFQTGVLSRDQVSRYIEDPRIRALTLTGSDRAGAAVAEQAGRNIKPIVLELGGSDAFIVLDSADVDVAAGTAAVCRLALGGQVCVSPKRIIVTEGVADEFTERFVAAFSSQVIGDPFDPGTTLGPLSNMAAAEALQAQYDDAIAKGAIELLPGGRLPGAGAFFKPAVLTGITPAMRLYHEEAFGPIGIVFRVKDADAAIVIANDTRYGLGGTVYGKDLDEANRVAKALDTGMVGINQYLGAPVEIPFGGTKASGVGRELGSLGMDAFANIKTYAIG